MAAKASSEAEALAPSTVTFSDLISILATKGHTEHHKPFSIFFDSSLNTTYDCSIPFPFPSARSEHTFHNS